MNLVNLHDVLPEEFYIGNTLSIAKLLLGKRIVRQLDDGQIAGTIVETEAYLRDDPASHAFRGLTQRNAPMFGPPARTYVYLSYGIHNMLNIVTADHGTGEAVLIRAIYPTDGIDLIRKLTSKATAPLHRLMAGPGLVAKAFGLSYKTDNNVDLTSANSALWLERSDDIPDENIVIATRIGITQAADRPYRFYIRDNPAVSRNERIGEHLLQNPDIKTASIVRRTRRPK